MKPEEKLKELLREAAQGDSSPLHPITSAEAEKERPAEAQSELDIEAINARILSLADLINNPLPDRKLEDILPDEE